MFPFTQGMRFQVGDKVIYNTADGRDLEATIVGIDMYDGTADVEFDDKQLIPPSMEVSIWDLKKTKNFIQGSKATVKVNGHTVGVLDGDVSFDKGFNFAMKDDTKCPVCKNPWKETFIGHTPYYDCLTCGKKKEDIVGS